MTKEIIKELHDAEVRTIMATGDNVLTAIHVGRECGIISGDADVIFGDLAGDGPEECKKIIWK